MGALKEQIIKDGKFGGCINFSWENHSEEAI